MMRKREKERDGVKKLIPVAFLIGLLAGAAAVAAFWLVPCENGRRACETGLEYSEGYNERLTEEVEFWRAQAEMRGVEPREGEER
jgi:hypothetical protein